MTSPGTFGTFSLVRLHARAYLDIPEKGAKGAPAHAPIRARAGHRPVERDRAATQ